jgi:hypothetical protein
MKARIYRPARTAMQQSGQANNHHWVLEFAPESPLFIDPLMGWTGMTDTAQEVRLPFTTQEEAIEYANRAGLEFEMKAPEARTVKPKSYATNFAFNRVIDTPQNSSE